LGVAEKLVPVLEAERDVEDERQHRRLGRLLAFDSRLDDEATDVLVARRRDPELTCEHDELTPYRSGGRLPSRQSLQAVAQS
jgi:hypothetical protein